MLQERMFFLAKWRLFDSFHATDLSFYTPWKTENFSDILREYRKNRCDEMDLWQ